LISVRPWSNSQRLGHDGELRAKRRSRFRTKPEQRVPERDAPHQRKKQQRSTRPFIGANRCAAHRSHFLHCVGPHVAPGQDAQAGRPQRREEPARPARACRRPPFCSGIDCRGTESLANKAAWEAVK
jgi:hypothetical protein